VFAQYSHYAEPTIAFSLKEHSKQSVPVKQPLHVVEAVERHARLPMQKRDCHRTRRRQPDRVCMSDDDADDDRLRRQSPGRLSYSDDELSVQQSVQRCGSHDVQLLLRGTKSDCRKFLTQSHDIVLQHQHAGSPRPIQHRCYACGLPAASG